MSFQTERPKSTAEMIAELKESKLERKSNRKALLENYNAKKLSDDRQSVLEATQAETEEKALTEEHIESIRDRRREERAVKEASLNRLTLLESAKKITMNKVLFEMVYDAYWLDDNVKRESIQETYNEYRNVLGLVENVCGGSKTKDGDKTEFIKNVESVVEEACKKAVDRIIKEQKESGEPTKEFEFTSEEESDLDKKLSELGRDEIVDLVKKKVLTVVQDERKSGKEKAEMLKELDNTENEEDSNDTGKTDSDGSDDDNTNNGEPGEEEAVEEGNIGPIRKGINKLALKWNHIFHDITLSDTATRAGKNGELEAAVRVYDKYSKTKYKRKYIRMRADVPDEAGHFYDTCRQLMPFVEPERMVGIVYMGYVPDKQMLCMIYIYRTDNGGLFVAVAKDQSFRCTEEDMNYFTAICINEYGIDPRSVKDVDEFLSYIYTNYPEEMKKEMRKTVTEGMVYEEEPVEEELGMAVAAGLVTASVVATGATIMGVMVAAVTLVKKDKLELKIAIDAYESSKHPKIKFSSLSAKQYELDRVDRPTNKELSGISKFFNKYSRRAEVWRSSSGEIVCSNVQYSDYYPGAYSDTTITHYLYDVNPKYKKDAAYLCASMCLADCISNKVSLTFVEDMKKEYPDKFKDIKLKDIRKTKIFGKSLESVECESTPENYKATLESMIAQKQRRSLRNSMGGTLFESFMIANSNSIRDEAIMEGMDVDTESTMNAALIETILQYTVLETLNTTKLYNFTSADVAKIKAHNRSTLRN